MSYLICSSVRDTSNLIGHSVRKRRSRLVAGWMTAVLDFVKDPTNEQALDGICVGFCFVLLCFVFFFFFLSVLRIMRSLSIL